MTARVVALDLSLTGTGCAEITGAPGEFDDHRTWSVESQGRAHPTWEQRAARLDRLATNIIRDVIGEDFITDPVTGSAPPSLVLIEGHVTGAPGDPHDRSGLWWLVYNRVREFGVPIAVVAPSVLKKLATGKGNASKLEVVSAMSRRWPLDMIANSDEWDALAMAEAGATWLGFRLPQAFTADQRGALRGITWPEVSRVRV